jgi:hypothetical protein
MVVSFRQDLLRVMIVFVHISSGSGHFLVVLRERSKAGFFACNEEDIMANFNPKHKAVLDDMLLHHPAIRPGKMFGFPAYYADKKLCICLYEEGVGLKVPEQTAARLLKEDKNIIPFQPYGKRRMREWIQINLKRSETYKHYQSVFDESISYVLAQQEKGKPG